MLPPMITGWPVSRYSGGSSGMPGRKARVAPLRCTSSRRAPPVDLVLLELGRVVGDVVDAAHAQLLRAPAEDLGEDLADAVEDHLAVGEGHVRGTIHGCEVVLPFGRGEGRAGQLAVDDLDAELRGHDVQEALQVVGGHLVAEAAAAAVEHHHHLVGQRDAEGPGRARGRRCVLGRATWISR